MPTLAQPMYSKHLYIQQNLRSSYRFNRSLQSLSSSAMSKMINHYHNSKTQNRLFGQNPCIKVVESLLGSGNSTSEEHDSQTIIHDIKIDSDRLFQQQFASQFYTYQQQMAMQMQQAQKVSQHRRSSAGQKKRKEHTKKEKSQGSKNVVKVQNLVVYPPWSRKGQKQLQRGETPQYRQLNTRQIGLFNNLQYPQALYKGLVPVSSRNVKEDGVNSTGSFSTRAAQEKRLVRLVPNPLSPGQMVKLYKGTTGRYSNSLTKLNTKQESSPVKVSNKRKNSAAREPNLGVQGVSNLKSTSIRPASKRNLTAQADKQRQSSQKKADISIQCNTQVIDLCDEMTVSEAGAEDARMSVSIQVTHSLAHSGKSTRRQIRISKQDLKNVHRGTSMSPRQDEEYSNLGLGGGFINCNESNLKDEVESDEGSSAQRSSQLMMDPKSARAENPLTQNNLDIGRDVRNNTIMLEDLVKTSQSPSSSFQGLRGSLENPNHAMTHELEKTIQASNLRGKQSHIDTACSASIPKGISATSPVETEKLNPSRLTNTQQQIAVDGFNADLKIEEPAPMSKVPSNRDIQIVSLSPTELKPTPVPEKIDPIQKEQEPKRSQRVQSATRWRDFQQGKTFMGRKEKIEQQKLRKMEQSNELARRQMELATRRYWKQVDIDVRKQNLALISKSSTRLLNFERKRRTQVIDTEHNTTKLERQDSNTDLNATGILSPKLDGPLSTTTGKGYEIFEQPLSDADTQPNELFNSFHCKRISRPPQSKQNSRMEQQKKVILDKFREHRLNEIRQKMQEPAPTLPVSEMRKPASYLTIQESAHHQAERMTAPNLTSDQNAIRKHKRNFFTTSSTPMATEKEFFDKNFAGIDKPKMLRVRKKYVDEAKRRYSQQRQVQTRAQSLMNQEKELFPQTLQTMRSVQGEII